MIWQVLPLIVQTAVVLIALEMSFNHKAAHSWVFVLGFSLMLFRRVTGFISSRTVPGGTVHSIDTAILPLIISLAFLVGLLAHRNYYVKVSKGINQEREKIKKEMTVGRE